MGQSPPQLKQRLQSVAACGLAAFCEAWEVGFWAAAPIVPATNSTPAVAVDTKTLFKCLFIVFLHYFVSVALL